MSKIIIKNEGFLRSYGYSSKSPDRTRHIALKKAIIGSPKGYSSVMKKLNAVQILNKNRNPEFSKIVGRDKEYIMKKFGKSPRKSPRKILKK
jgi:hypothetical protein